MTDSPTSYREAVARIIDPTAVDWTAPWRVTSGFYADHTGPHRQRAIEMDEDDERQRMYRRRVSAYQRADDILALREEQPSETPTDLTRLEVIARLSDQRHLMQGDGLAALIRTAQSAVDMLIASPVIKGGVLGASGAESAARIASDHAATEPPSPAGGERVTLRLCGYCKNWNSRPCGDGCALQITDPAWSDQ